MKHREPIATSLPEPFKDAVYVHTDITFCWKDRIRILLGRPVHVHTRTLIVIPTPQAVTDTVEVWVSPILRQKPGIAFEVEAKP